MMLQMLKNDSAPVWVRNKCVRNQQNLDENMEAMGQHTAITFLIQNICSIMPYSLYK